MTIAALVDYIDQHRKGMPIAPSSYYAVKTNPPSARAVADERHVEVIRRVCADNYGVYGVRRCTPS